MHGDSDQVEVGVVVKEPVEALVVEVSLVVSVNVVKVSVVVHCGWANGVSMHHSHSP